MCACRVEGKVSEISGKGSLLIALKSLDLGTRELRRGQRQGETDKKHVSCKLCGALFTVLSIEVLPFLTKWQ